MALLSHYTSYAGLEGIARSKMLWATDFLNLNDTTEMFFGHSELAKAALPITIAECKRLMTSAERASALELDLGKAATQVSDFYRNLYATNPNLERLHVTSFARPHSVDQEQRGALSLWARYTQHKGYCLQFEESEIRLLAQEEQKRRVYAFIELAEVSYGINAWDPEFLDLRHQLSLRYLGEVQRGRPGLGVDPKRGEWWSLEELATRVMKFVCHHKDPLFSEEREVRIVALPASSVPARMLINGKRAKPVHCLPERRYITLGADWADAIEPVRIIVGRDAEPDITKALTYFRRAPEVVRPRFPLVGA